MNTAILLSIVIPMYNEANVISDVLTLLQTTLSTQFPDMCYEILVIDDGSSDGLSLIHISEPTRPY